MRKCDIYWKSNKDWWHIDSNEEYAINDDAPQEAKESFERWLAQIERPDEW